MCAPHIIFRTARCFWPDATDDVVAPKITTLVGGKDAGGVVKTRAKDDMITGVCVCLFVWVVCVVQLKLLVAFDLCGN